ncbi:MAG: sulfotransferase [Actinobacteria bacterium]|nr:sulfotransferase [Actinomycetota bacterium]
MWRPAPRTDAALAALAAAEEDLRTRPERYRLDVDHIAGVAARSDGDEDRFDSGWRSGSEHYLGSAVQDGRLNAMGTLHAARTAIGRLRAGAAMSRFREEHPTEARTPIAPPIFITGGWRTGTTFLFRLLATDPRLRAPLPAELAAPWRVALMHDDERERFIDASVVSQGTLHALNPELRAIHDSGGRLPEECGIAMGTDLRNWAFTSTTRLDSYADWLAGEDLRPTYRNYRSAIEALDLADGRRWVLKAPPHLAELDALATAFPGAVVVVLHRDIVETIASGASLFAVFRSTFSDDVDAADVGRFQADQTERWLRRARSFRSGPSASAVTVVDLDYRELVADPGAAISTVYRAADIEPPDDLAEFVAAYDEANPRHAHGTHRYTAADFGLDEAELRERFADLVG